MVCSSCLLLLLLLLLMPPPLLLPPISFITEAKNITEYLNHISTMHFFQHSVMAARVMHFPSAYFFTVYFCVQPFSFQISHCSLIHLIPGLLHVCILFLYLFLWRRIERYCRRKEFQTLNLRMFSTMQQMKHTGSCITAIGIAI